jgi:transposase
MNVLSKDLRQRILNYALTHPVRQTAAIFQVSPDTVQRLKNLYYETGGIVLPAVQAIHEHAVSPEGELYLQILLRENVDMTLAQLCDRYEEAYGVRVGVTTMHNTLKRLDYSLKKKTFYDPKRLDDEAIGEKLSYISQLDGIKPEDRLYLDEMGSALNLNLDYGRSPQGERVYDANPTAPGETISTAAVLTENGVEAAGLYFGTLNARRFIFYLEMYVLDLLVGGKVLIMDNHPVHCAKAVQQFLEKHNVPYVYLPRYSPELNPIEEAFSKIKHFIRKLKPRTSEALFNAIQSAIKAVTQNDVIGYVNHAEEFL